jgi:hypothetical protein
MMIQEKISQAVRDMHINAGQSNQRGQSGDGNGVDNGVGPGVSHGLMQSNMGR